jgi:hypothetical protein
MFTTTRSAFAPRAATALHPGPALVQADGGLSVPAGIDMSMLVKQIDVLLALFELFRATPQPMTLTRLSEGLRQPKSNMSNIVETLRRRGYLYEVARRGGFYPSRRMFDLMREIVAADPIVELFIAICSRWRRTAAKPRCSARWTPTA